VRVVWSPLALDRLEAIASFIALDKPSAADKWVNDVCDRTDLLSSQPKMGREVPELPDSDYREIIFGSYRIIYKIESMIQILTVRNGRQMLSSNDIEL
jgi:toxin ParE1/3/4